jgi:DNA-binding CsgD family transcriptional regulator
VTPSVALPPRLLRTLRLVNVGMSNGQIAARLKVTRVSVERYVSLLYGAIGGTTRFAMIERARRLGLLVTPSKQTMHPRDPSKLTDVEQRVGKLALQLLSPMAIARRLGMSSGSVLSRMVTAAPIWSP